MSILWKNFFALFVASLNLSYFPLSKTIQNQTAIHTAKVYNISDVSRVYLGVPLTPQGPLQVVFFQVALRGVSRLAKTAFANNWCCSLCFSYEFFRKIKNIFSTSAWNHQGHQWWNIGRNLAVISRKSVLVIIMIGRIFNSVISVKHFVYWFVIFFCVHPFAAILIFDHVKQSGY